MSEKWHWIGEETALPICSCTDGRHLASNWLEVDFLNQLEDKLTQAQNRVAVLERHFRSFENYGVVDQDVPRCPRCGNEDGILGTECVYFVCEHCRIETGHGEQYWTPDNKPAATWRESANVAPWWRSKNIKHRLEAAERECARLQVIVNQSPSMNEERSRELVKALVAIRDSDLYRADFETADAFALARDILQHAESKEEIH